jgi:hypothetical protein
VSALEPGAIEGLRARARQTLEALADIGALKGDGGGVRCPRCGGTLRWWRVGPKRHLRAQCQSTPGCLSFLE